MTADGQGDDTAGSVPPDVEAFIGIEQHRRTSDFPVERGYVWTWCAATANANPLFWDDEVAAALAGGPVAPPTMLAAWGRPHAWAPPARAVGAPLQAHFDLKERFALPEAVMTESALELHRPVRLGDVVTQVQVLRSVSAPKRTRLGEGRFWVIDTEYREQSGALLGIESTTSFAYRRPDPAPPATTATTAATPGASDGGYDGDGGDATPVSGTVAAGRSVTFDEVQRGAPLPDLVQQVTATTVVLGATANRVWAPMHHDRDVAVESGAADIFLDLSTQLAWLERLVTDWCGPSGRLGRLVTRLRTPVVAGDAMRLGGTVREVGIDATGCAWVDLDLHVDVGGELCTTATARLALPRDAGNGPWARDGTRWCP